MYIVHVHDSRRHSPVLQHVADYGGENKYVRPRNTRTEMYAGRVTCCLLVSDAEYAPTGQTD